MPHIDRPDKRHTLRLVRLLVWLCLGASLAGCARDALKGPSRLTSAVSDLVPGGGPPPQWEPDLSDNPADE